MQAHRKMRRPKPVTSSNLNKTGFFENHAIRLVKSALEIENGWILLNRSDQKADKSSKIAALF